MANRKNGEDGNNILEMLMGRQLGALLDKSGRDCPDADLLAAFASRTLDAAEYSLWERHAAGCARCQSNLVALARAGAQEAPASEQKRALEKTTNELIDEDSERAPHGEDEGIVAAIRRGFRFVLGPFPLSVAIHVALILLLIITVHEQRGRELIMVNLEAGGGGGGGNEMQDLDMPEVPMPDTAAQQEAPQAVDTSQAVGLANDYVRAAGGGGIGIGRGGGMGSGYGHGIGSGFGGFIGELRRKGLDVVLVIDGTGSMSLIINDVKAKMAQLIQAIHRLVPIARVGIIVFGGKGEKMEIQPLTLSPAKLTDFLGHITAKGGGEWEEDTFGACQTAMDKMDWKPYAKKVVVLVGDSPPHKDDFAPLIAMIHKFKEQNGTFNTVDVAAEEHERFEREFWLKVHREEPPKISPLPEFYQQTRAAYKVLANAGGGAMRSLTHDSHINQQVLILAFGEQWQNQVSAFGRGISSGGGSG
ncbi:MAG TPA: VWA domain-containing protein, partial [Candidatus Binataceae bacterium]|nr:VWA domain-containing protein [Candidatus Binataceae bacterium]